MGRNGSHTEMTGQGANICATTNQPFAIISAAKDLIYQEEQWKGLVLFQLCEQSLEPPHLGIEVGIAVRYRVAHANAGEKAKRLCMQATRIDWPTGVGQHKIDA